MSEVRVMLNDSRTRSLMFGFVTVASSTEATEMERLLNGTFFMGRKLRVALRRARQGATKSISGTEQEPSSGFTIQVTFSSNFAENDNRLIRPTELWLRKKFMKFGVVLDCCVKDYQPKKASNSQSGYGFITFQSIEVAMNVASVVQSVEWEGIKVSCNMQQFHTGERRPKSSSLNDSLDSLEKNNKMSTEETMFKILPITNTCAYVANDPAFFPPFATMSFAGPFLYPPVIMPPYDHLEVYGHPALRTFVN